MYSSTLMGTFTKIVEAAGASLRSLIGHQWKSGETVNVRKDGT